MDRKEFLEKAPLAAKAAAARLGCDPLVIVSQACLETGFGEHTPHRDDGRGESFNFFGIKADASWHGPCAGGRTREFVNGKWIAINGKFRAYESLEAGFMDYAAFIKGNPRYQEALAVAGNPELYLQRLQKAGYASDPRYAIKVLGVLSHIERSAAALT
jgi:flagellar protein FlgJ